MLIDLNKLSGPQSRETEICIIGAGAAGLTLARRLLTLGHELVLLESGGDEYEAETADLNAGKNVGEDYYELDHARLRFFGGTTAIWGGRCAELDPIDLEARPWLPHSGWPISHSELRGYYRQARPLLDLTEEPENADVLREAGVPIPEFDPDRLSVPVWSFDARFNRFGIGACADLVADPRCTIILHATATEILAEPGGKSIDRVLARAPSGTGLDVRARIVILAAGGIENPRILLASRSVMPKGLGNEQDLVGRFFMEHPHARGGRIVEAKAWALLKAFGGRHRLGRRDLAALIAPAAKLQAERHILNSSLTIVGRQPEQARQFWGMRAYGAIKHSTAPTKGGRRLWTTTKRAVGLIQRAVDPFRPWLLHKAGRLDVALLVRAEQAPNPDSRVTLSSEKDALGVSRVKLDWRLSPIDVRSVEALVETLGEELERLGLGRVEPASWLKQGEGWRTDPLISAHPVGGYHHMGTTRMADAPRSGVADADTRVNGISNLYIAGSSLFPTSGWANPTLTIVALALRTADKVSAELRKRAGR